MKLEITLPYNWKARHYQTPLFRYLENGGKRAVCVWHRRAGKDECCLHWAAIAAHMRAATYWHMLPEAAQARKAIWNAVNPKTGVRRIDEAFPHELRANTNDHEMFIRFLNGSTWQVVGSDNFNSLVGSPPAGVIKSEWSLANPAANAYLRPILLENNGWDISIYTPRGRNHGLTTYQAAKSDPTAFAQLLTVDDTGIFTKEQIEIELQNSIKEYGEAHGRALFRQEYYCSFDAAIIGSIYGEWIEKAMQARRICKVAYDPKLEVHTAWDLGRSDQTAIWFFQVVYGEIRLIDYHESNGKDIPYYIDEVIKGRPYNYGKHYVPRDATRKLLEAGGRSFVEQAYMNGKGIKCFVVPETTHINRHAAVRQMLPMTWMDEEKCARGIECCRQYRYKWDEDKRCFSKDPVHDEFSHGATALDIVARVWKNPPMEDPADKPRFLNDMRAQELFWPEDQGRRIERI